MGTIEELGNRLQSEAVGTLAVDLFLGQLPDTPDTATALLEYGGLEPERVYNDFDASREMPRIQVMCRSRGYTTARALIESAYRALDFANTSLGGTWYLRCRPLQSPFFLKRDENERWVFVFNAQIEKKYSI